MYYTKRDAEAAIGAIYADAYLRYSDKNQDELSIEYQMEEVQEYADKNGIVIRKWYIDRAKSAKKVAGRDEFYQYIDTVKSGTAAPVFLVWRTNRAFRNSYESHIYRKLLRESGIRFDSATQNIDEDTSSGRLVTNILADIDQYKSEETGDHVTAASRSLVKRNPAVYLGQLPLFGYMIEPWRDGNANRAVYAIDENESPVVQQIFLDFIGGKSLYQIAAWMNEQGHVTRRGIAWSYHTVREMIRNDFYKGTRSYMKKSDDPIIIENGVPAIIDVVTWQRAQDSFRKAAPGAGIKPRRQSNGRVYALTGKLICTMCNGTLCGKGGKDYQYYVCKNMESGRGCTCKRIRKEKLEQYVLNQIRLHILNDDMIDTIAEQAVKAFNALPSSSKSLEELKKESMKFRRQVAELVQMKLDGLIDAETLSMMKQEKEAAISEIEKEMSMYENVPEMPTEREIIARVKQLISEAEAADVSNGEMIKALFDQVVQSVEISNDSVVVTLSIFKSLFLHKLKDGSPVISLCEKEDYKELKKCEVQTHY